MRSRTLPLLLALALSGLAACDTGEPSPDEIRRVFIREIDVDAAPIFNPDDPDGDWDGDLGGGPDIYVDLVNDDTGSILFSTDNAVVSNVRSQDLPLVFTITPELDFSRFDTPLAFDLYDYDPTTADDFMGSTERFTIQDILDAGAPAFYRVESADGQVVVSVRLRYER